MTVLSSSPALLDAFWIMDKGRRVLPLIALEWSQNAALQRERNHKNAAPAKKVVCAKR